MIPAGQRHRCEGHMCASFMQDCIAPSKLFPLSHFLGKTSDFVVPFLAKNCTKSIYGCTVWCALCFAHLSLWTKASAQYIMVNKCLCVHCAVRHWSESPYLRRRVLLDAVTCPSCSVQALIEQQRQFHWAQMINCWFVLNFGNPLICVTGAVAVGNFSMARNSAGLTSQCHKCG